MFYVLKYDLERRDYHPSIVEPLVFYRNDSVILICFDGLVIVSHKQETIKSLINSKNNGLEEYMLKEKGCISNYLWDKIKNNSNGTFKQSQWNLVEKNQPLHT